MQKRIIISVVLSVLLIMGSLGIISYLSVNESIGRSMQNRLALANIISKYIENILESNLTRLYDISLSGRIDLKDGNWLPEKKALKTAYEYSIFTDRIFLLDLEGNVVLKYPHQEGKALNLLSIPYVSRALSEKRQLISDIYTFKKTGRKVIFTLVPLRNKHGEIVGLAGGEINPANYVFTQVIKSVSTGDNTSIELIDSLGTIIASDDPKRMLTSSDHDEFLSNLIVKKKSSVAICHRCHSEEKEKKSRTKDMLAFSPLSIAPWGISVREPQDMVFAPATKIKEAFLVIGIIFLGTSLLLAIGMSRSVVRPIQSLINATQRIAKGYLEEPIQISSSDEIESLARSFEHMRVKLNESHNKIKEHSIVLENKVMERTKALRKSRMRLSKLLDAVITAQEEERKRVARELHDETSQTLAALGMSIDIASMAMEENSLTKEEIQELKEKLGAALDGINIIIKDLRPPIFDDLGLESGVRWLLENHLGEKGIEYSLIVTNGFKGFCRRNGKPGSAQSKTELMLFRVIQEAVINIAKHTEASNVSIYLCSYNSIINIGIEDNGGGFDVKQILDASDRDDNIGFGILGMKERIALLDGELYICSEPGGGTFINVEVPVSSLGVSDA